MSVTAQMVKELRERSGAGMMECKKALVATGGDMEAAMEHLRKTGLAAADKKAGRTAAEGVIALAKNGENAILVEVNCETDFVAKRDEFKQFADEVAGIALAQGITEVEPLMAQTGDSQDSLEATRQALVANIGENIQVRRIVKASGSTLGSYIHGGRIGVLVEMEGGDEETAKDVAMHVAAMNPPYVSVDEVPEAVMEKEREILTAQAQDSGKPAEIIAKMVEGRLKKYLKENTLIGQPFVKDPDLSVEKLLSAKSATVTRFQRIEVGEGIEKKEDDFAAEVMAQVQGGG